MNAKSILGQIGNTPIIQFNKISETLPFELLAKCEFMNPGGSVKDRAALSMIEAAEKEGLVDKDTVIVEPTSGNTGIALALVCAVKGYRLIITMPDSMSLERRHLLKAYGVELVLTPGHLQMGGAIEEAQNIAKSHPKSFIPQQFQNSANPNAHFCTTGPEIWEATNGQVDAFVAGVGTGGSVTGIAKYLKSKNPELKAYAVEPKDSPVLSGGRPGPHMIQGIGAGFIPKNVDTQMIDQVLQVTNEAAMDMSRRLAKEEGLLVGISSGANVAAAMQLAKDKRLTGKRIVVILCDVGERYLSTTLFR